MTNEPVITAPHMLWAYCHQAQGFSTRAQKLESCAEPSAALAYPTGCCIQASVAMMKNPLVQEPRKTRNPAHQCPRGPNRFSPKRNRPRNADSRKNAKTPSMASVCPMIPPAKREKCDQLVPN